MKAPRAYQSLGSLSFLELLGPLALIRSHDEQPGASSRLEALLILAFKYLLDLGLFFLNIIILIVICSITIKLHDNSLIDFVC